jgi:hypothetical protein
MPMLQSSIVWNEPFEEAILDVGNVLLYPRISNLIANEESVLIDKADQSDVK